MYRLGKKRGFFELIDDKQIESILYGTASVSTAEILRAVRNDMKKRKLSPLRPRRDKSRPE